MDKILQQETIKLDQSFIISKILIIRNKKVMLDKDLAMLYSVKTRVLNQAVKRNKGSFPTDFMFQVSADEKNKLVTECDRLSSYRYSSFLPYAFTEYGILMLSSILKSEIARKVNIQIIRAFVHFKQQNSELYIQDKFNEIDLKFKEVHAALKVLFENDKTIFL